MGDEMTGAILRLILFAGLIVMVWAVCRIKNLPLQATLGIYRVLPKQLTLWGSLFLVLMVIEEFSVKLLGVASPDSWTYSLPVILVRAFGIILTAPIAEELVFRGLLFSRIRATRLGLVGAIILPAVLFAAAHLQYGLPLLLIILIDGVFFGLARHYSGTILLPMILHSLGNTYAVFERLAQ